MFNIQRNQKTMNWKGLVFATLLQQALFMKNDNHQVSCKLQEHSTIFWSAGAPNLNHHKFVHWLWWIRLDCFIMQCLVMHVSDFLYGNPTFHCNIIYVSIDVISLVSCTISLSNYHLLPLLLLQMYHFCLLSHSEWRPCSYNWIWFSVIFLIE